MKPMSFVCAVAAAVAITSQAAPAPVPVMTPVPSYVVTNYAASTNSGAISDQASGLWLGNLRNKDSWRDLIIANKNSDTISLRLCRDDGTFGTVTNYSVGPAPMGVRSANLNDDKYEDIVVANSGTNTVTVWMNYGTRLLDRVDYTVATNPVAVTIGDANSDGVADILAASSTSNTVSVLLKGSGTFSLSTNVPVGMNPRSVQLIDMDGNGRDDIVTANKDDGTVTIAYQTASGVFGAISNLTVLASTSQPIQALGGKFNTETNALMDLACANYNSNSVTIFRGFSNGLSFFTNYAVGGHPTSMVLRDFNRDGRTDIAVACDNGRVDVLIANGDYTFALACSVNLDPGSSPSTITGSNFNNDQNNDIAVANNGNNSISILLYDIPVAYNTSVTAKEDSTNTFNLIATVPQGIEGRVLTYSVVTPPSHGSCTNTDATVTYVPTNNYFGADSLAFRVSDGVRTSEVATVTISVANVNDAPSFTVSTNQVNLAYFNFVNTISNFVTSVDLGATNEANQRPSFYFVSTVPGFFTSCSIDTNGTLKFKAATNAVGTNVVSIYLKDSGGTTYGGVNTSAVATVTFIASANGYPALQGTYNGLFYDANVANESAGFMTLTLNSSGAFSGKTILGRTYSMSGRFDANGAATIAVARGTLPALSVHLVMNPGGTNDLIGGTISDGTWTANVLLDKYTWNLTNNPATSLAGRYTMLISGSGNPADSPPGQSYGTAVVDYAGKIKASGVLADGKSFSQSTALSKNGQWPLYYSLYGTNGCLLSWVTFTNLTTSSFQGSLAWIKTAAASPYSTYYTNGFANNLSLQGSTYVTNTGWVLNTTNAATLVSGGDLTGNLTNTVSLSLGNVFRNLGGTASNLRLKTTLSSGIISGSFKHPYGVTMTIRGVVFQQQTNAGGFFLGPVQGGYFELQGN